MNILFLSLAMIENINDRGIYTDLLRVFKNEGHNIHFVSPLEKRLGRKTELIEEDNVSYLMIQTGNITKTNFIEKGISTLLIEKQFINAIKKYYANVHFDLIIYSTPPITFVNVVKYLKNRDSAKTYLLLKDIFPQNAVDLNLIRENGLIHRYFNHQEKQLYQISDYIGTMSPANTNYLIEHNPYFKTDFIEEAPNSIQPLNKKLSHEEKIAIKEKYQLPIDKTIFIYGGNLGKPQGIAFLKEVLLKNESNQNSFFLIVGSGTEYENLQAFFREHQLKNAALLSALPKLDYDNLVYASDVGLIFLDYHFTIPNFPSRLLSYMEAGLPVVSATDPNTDIGDIIEKGNFGYQALSNNAEVYNQIINKINNTHTLQEFGQNSRTYLENNYDVNNVYQIIMQHFE